MQWNRRHTLFKMQGIVQRCLNPSAAALRMTGAPVRAPSIVPYLFDVGFPTAVTSDDIAVSMFFNP